MHGLVCLLALPGFLALWLLISPRSMWRSTVAWQRRNPELFEPSEASYVAQRVIAGVTLVMLVFLGVFMVHTFNKRDSDQRDRQSRYEEYDNCIHQHLTFEDQGSAEGHCAFLSPPASP